MKILNPKLIAYSLAAYVCASPVYAQNLDNIDSASSTFTVNAGQAQIFNLPSAVRRVAIADVTIADYRLINASQIYVLGKKLGRTSLFLWDGNGKTYQHPIDVRLDPRPVRELIALNLPEENAINVSSAAAAYILNGMASDMVAADAALQIAKSHATAMEKQLSGVSVGTTSQRISIDVINMMKIRDAQQVLLEVRIAEVSKSLIDRMGLNVTGTNPNGNFTWSVGSNFLGSGGGTASLLFQSNGNSYALDLDAERRKGLVKILAEPTIVAMSGEQGTFLVGGKVFIPIPQSSGNGTSAITLEEREFGVGLKFIPTVLDSGRINLKVEPEVSQLSKEPINFGIGQSATLLPSFTSTKVSTTVQLRDGQSLVIGGLLRNNVVATTKIFPFLGEIPIIGALFRSNDFAKDMTELVVVVRPRLIDASDNMPVLPTDKIRDATRAEMMIEGALDKPVTPAPVAPNAIADGKSPETLARELSPGLNRRLGPGTEPSSSSSTQSEGDEKK